MDAENSEILRELDDTLPDNVSLTDNVQNNLSTDLDTDLEKFDVPNDGFDQPETVFGCEVEVGESLGETGDSFGCAKELTQDATETEESVKALLEQEKGNFCI